MPWEEVERERVTCACCEMDFETDYVRYCTECYCYVCCGCFDYEHEMCFECVWNMKSETSEESENE